MEKIKQYYLLGSTFISYDNGLKGVVMVERKDGIIPAELDSEDLYFITKYPNVMAKLMNGESLYLKGSKGYIGKKEYVGPYGEEEVFLSEYSSQNIDINELMICIEKSIERGEVKALRLPKMGNHFND